ncbi:hypothetical protein [Thermocrinis sp.]
MAGDTDSTDFPGTSGGAQTSYAGSNDVFVARLTADLAAGSGGGSGGGGSGGGSSGGGGGCSMTGHASPVNAIAWLLLPAFALARRIRRK